MLECDDFETAYYPLPNLCFFSGCRYRARFFRPTMNITTPALSLSVNQEYKASIHIFFYRQLDFSSEPGVANEFWENEAESCLVVA